MDEWELYDKLMAQHCPSDSTTEIAQIACKHESVECLDGQRICIDCGEVLGFVKIDQHS